MKFLNYKLILNILSVIAVIFTALFSILDSRITGLTTNSSLFRRRKRIILLAMTEIILIFITSLLIVFLLKDRLITLFPEPNLVIYLPIVSIIITTFQLHLRIILTFKYEFLNTDYGHIIRRMEYGPYRPLYYNYINRILYLIITTICLSPFFINELDLHVFIFVIIVGVVVIGLSSIYFVKNSLILASIPILCEIGLSNQIKEAFEQSSQLLGQLVDENDTQIIIRWDFSNLAIPKSNIIYWKTNTVAHLLNPLISQLIYDLKVYEKKLLDISQSDINQKEMHGIWIMSQQIIQNKVLYQICNRSDYLFIQKLSEIYQNEYAIITEKNQFNISESDIMFAKDDIKTICRKIGTLFSMTIKVEM